MLSTMVADVHARTNTHAARNPADRWSLTPEGRGVFFLNGQIDHRLKSEESAREREGRKEMHVGAVDIEVIKRSLATAARLLEFRARNDYSSQH